MLLLAEMMQSGRACLRWLCKLVTLGQNKGEERTDDKNGGPWWF